MQAPLIYDERLGIYRMSSSASVHGGGYNGLSTSPLATATATAITMASSAVSYANQHPSAALLPSTMYTSNSGSTGPSYVHQQHHQYAHHRHAGASGTHSQQALNTNAFYAPASTLMQSHPAHQLLQPQQHAFHSGAFTASKNANANAQMQSQYVYPSQRAAAIVASKQEGENASPLPVKKLEFSPTRNRFAHEAEANGHYHYAAHHPFSNAGGLSNDNFGNNHSSNNNNNNDNNNAASNWNGHAVPKEGINPFSNGFESKSHAEIFLERVDRAISSLTDIRKLIVDQIHHGKFSTDSASVQSPVPHSQSQSQQPQSQGHHSSSSTSTVAAAVPPKRVPPVPSNRPMQNDSPAVHPQATRSQQQSTSVSALGSSSFPSSLSDSQNNAIAASRLPGNEAAQEQNDSQALPRFAGPRSRLLQTALASRR
eukprot:ANDGO_08589.mRNA.1 hypothetical protein